MRPPGEWDRATPSLHLKTANPSGRLEHDTRQDPSSDLFRLRPWSAVSARAGSVRGVVQCSPAAPGCRFGSRRLRPTHVVTTVSSPRRKCVSSVSPQKIRMEGENDIISLAAEWVLDLWHHYEILINTSTGCEGDNFQKPVPRMEFYLFRICMTFVHGQVKGFRMFDSSREWREGGA